MSADRFGLARKHRSGPVAGFTLIELAVVAMVITLGAVWLAGRWQNQVEDAGAEATAAYLMTVRGATQALMVHYHEPLLGQPGDPPQVVPPFLAGAWPLRLDLAHLQQALPEGGPGFLPAGFPATPPLGGGVGIQLERQGSCPGPGCRLAGFVHTLAPLRAGGTDHSPELVGALMLATAGYGVHAPPGAPDRLRGALLDVANPVGAVPGIVGVVASLEATHFHQFVRQGDSRPVRLQNRLSVAGPVATGGGVQLLTAVTPGAACTLAQGYARTLAGTLASCLSGIWFELDRHVIQGIQGGLVEGDRVPQPECPPPAVAFAHLALETLDVEVPGDRIQVRGAVAGSFSGGGSTDAAGNVTVTGSFGGNLSSTADSRLQVRQGVSLVDGRVRFDDPGGTARAYAIHGCRQG